ncbi:GNAT family N-acetyltransferase [Halalkalibacterium halodurans]|uniref:BH1000 protein n=1 Tax=Halalkalibacterium halodurans (strain ATCC BAA-125 / DSM 18197 / FERM 7344 / JCM 9153 / C-125) TaxID=272558 RepID=Q9KE58_HALH5|nr:GNAT family N-acetyltransferase [Halalkalibacterium halodurans]MDY7221537.1 GNAT family N-acetyltransferase [Halalkalibacterium halodurans]MDY7240813.1 GNAT family N-acetyltransferase [Halalkalibacterium halodurans]MED4080468.1 GNAT family N-acetyltransferase [Halalkalibacterium halodurans]MED4086519.1 GNAT family N-acetyltransferase [Halalkalibacterium halodurans]MED4104772.1 GNAT family N-acetyltransferase [Halalkalibacterium halodurans]
MAIVCNAFQSIPEKNVVAGILHLHEQIFGQKDNLLEKMERKPNILIFVALDRGHVVGYKIGYELDKQTFYSWLGGVDPNIRKQGIGSMLMERQHDYLRDVGYKVVRTKTMNKWRNMLLLNIKSGFDVIETYIDDKGLHKIVLEKKLDASS